MIWFATLKPRGNHILFISAYKSIEKGAEGIFLKIRQDCSPHNSLKVQFPPISTILVALLGRETDKKNGSSGIQLPKLAVLVWGLAPVSEPAEILWCTGKGRGKWGVWTTATFLRQTSVTNWIFCALWDYINYSNVSDQNASKKQLPPGCLSPDYQSLLEVFFTILPFHLLI